MMPSPIEAEARRWTTPTAPLTTAMVISAAPSHDTWPRSPPGIASSISEPITSGCTAVSDEMTTIVASTTAMWSL